MLMHGLHTVTAACTLAQALEFNSLGSAKVGRRLIKVHRDHLYRFIHKRWGMSKAHLEKHDEEVRLAFTSTMLHFKVSDEVACPLERRIDRFTTGPKWTRIVFKATKPKPVKELSEASEGPEDESESDYMSSVESEDSDSDEGAMSH